MKKLTDRQVETLKEFFTELAHPMSIKDYFRSQLDNQLNTKTALILMQLGIIN